VPLYCQWLQTELLLGPCEVQILEIHPLFAMNFARCRILALNYFVLCYIIVSNVLREINLMTT
jgi:hypothetical protein